MAWWALDIPSIDELTGGEDSYNSSPSSKRDIKVILSNRSRALRPVECSAFRERLTEAVDPAAQLCQSVL